MPVTTFPIAKTPIHASYLLYLSTFSPAVGRVYWSSALAMCRAMGVQPSLLLHPLDFLSGEDVAELKFFPGMNMPIERKLELVSGFIKSYTDSFDVVTMREHATSVRNGLAAHAQHSEVLS
jgi:hypothetical protein